MVKLLKSKDWSDIVRPRAKEVKPMENYMLLITFDNGEKKMFDVKPYLSFKIFEDLKKVSIFNTVHVAGLSIELIHGQDICPDELYFDSVDIGSMSTLVNTGTNY